MHSNLLFIFYIAGNDLCVEGSRLLNLAFVESCAERVTRKACVFVQHLTWLLEYRLIIFNACRGNWIKTQEIHLLSQLFQLHSIHWGGTCVAPSLASYPLDNTSRHSSLCTPKSQVQLWHIRVQLSLMAVMQGSAHGAEKYQTVFRNISYIVGSYTNKFTDW